MRARRSNQSRCAIAVFLGWPETVRDLIQIVQYYRSDGSIFALCRRLAFAFLITLFLSVSRGQEVPSVVTTRDAHQPTVSAGAESSIRPILEVLTDAGLSGALEYSGHCKSLTYPEFPEFPEIILPIKSSSSPLRTLQRTFATKSRFRVAQSSSGIIRMVENGVPQDFLKVRISYMSFGSGVYNPNIALQYIISSPEVESYMKSHSIDWPFVGGVANGIVGENLDQSPHISGSLHGVSVEDVLDRILKVFPGVWIYEDCPKSASRNRIVYLQFYRLQRSVDGAVVQ